MPKFSSSWLNLTVQKIILVALLLVAGLFSASIGRSVLESWTAHSVAAEQQEFDLGANRFIQGLYEVLIERLETNNALQNAEPASQSVLAKIAASRKIVSDNFDAGLAVLEHRDFPSKPELLQVLKTALQQASDYRRQADEAIKLPLDRRDQNLVKTFIPVITNSVNAALNVWFAALYNSAKDNPQLARLAAIKEIGWRMRDYSGQERSIVASALVSGSAISADQLPAIAAHRTRVTLLWAELQNLTADAGTHPAIKAAMQAAEQKYFKEFLSLSDQMRKLSDAGQKYPMTAAQWVDVTNPQIGALLDVLYAAGKASEAVTGAALERSARALELAVVILAIGIGIALACMWVVIARVTRPLSQLARALRELSEGNFQVVLPGLGRRDEIGEMAQAVETFKVKAQEKAHHEAEAKAEADRRAAAKRKADMQKLADEFEAAVGEIIETVSSASTELEASATTLTKTAEAAQKVSTAVAAASEEASTNVQSVASATEEMASSIGEIGRQVQESSHISNEAVSQAQKTDDHITKLAQAASRIGDVTRLITSIAEQTNLLALNATIEAARAGDAGRGFAVVAHEVKALASQTAKATSEISGQIAEIQSTTQDSVGAIKEIRSTIGRISEIAATIASAVEQQGAATHEITRNVQQAAAGTAEVATNITDVNRGAAETGSASSQVLSSAQSLANESNRLKLEMSKFVATVRAA